MSFFNKKTDEKKVPPEKCTWEQFLNELSDMLDKDIISYAQSSGKFYLGGKCCFSAIVSENEFSKATYLITKAEMYYKKNFVEGAEVRTVSFKRNFNSFDFRKDENTLVKLRELVNEPYEINIERPILKNGKDEK